MHDVVQIARTLPATGRKPGALERDPHAGSIGCQVVGCLGGSDGQQVTHYFDPEGDARKMLQRVLDTTPAPVANWGRMTLTPTKR